MEKQWFEMTESELVVDEEAQEAKRLAYATAFYGTEEGKQVMFDIRRCCYTARGGESMLALIGFYENIRECCGITEEKEKNVIDAEAEIV